jgi:hypothetical protein
MPSGSSREYVSNQVVFACCDSYASGFVRRFNSLLAEIVKHIVDESGVFSYLR